MKTKDTISFFLLTLGFSSLLPLLFAAPARSETIRAPLTSTVTINGTTGGSQQSQCGFIGDRPSHQLIVTEPLVSLRFTLEAGGAPTLFIQNAQGRGECVMSDRLSQGTIELPGAWERGNYSVYIGDRNGENHSYRLSVSQGF